MAFTRRIMQYPGNIIAVPDWKRAMYFKTTTNASNTGITYLINANGYLGIQHTGFDATNQIDPDCVLIASPIAEGLYVKYNTNAGFITKLYGRIRIGLCGSLPKESAGMLSLIQVSKDHKWYIRALGNDCHRQNIIFIPYIGDTTVYTQDGENAPLIYINDGVSRAYGAQSYGKLAGNLTLPINDLGDPALIQYNNQNRYYYNARSIDVADNCLRRRLPSGEYIEGDSYRFSPNIKLTNATNYLGEVWFERFDNRWRAIVWNRDTAAKVNTMYLSPIITVNGDSVYYVPNVIQALKDATWTVATQKEGTSRTYPDDRNENGNWPVDPAAGHEGFLMPNSEYFTTTTTTINLGLVDNPKSLVTIPS